jgi:hypothetical protein
MFIYFFVQEAKVGYHSKMQSNKYKSEASKHDRKNIIAKFGKVKKIVKLMLINIGSYPDNKPTDPKELAAWQENLLKLGRQAENNIYAWINKDKSIPFEKFNISNVLTNKTVCRQMQDSLKLPSNTPACELKFFNSRSLEA